MVAARGSGVVAADGQSGGGSPVGSRATVARLVVVYGRPLPFQRGGAAQSSRVVAAHGQPGGVARGLPGGGRPSGAV
ncbi:hypothetical protein ACFYSF_46415 [Streptomyces canus]|uniref:hypothetical protein n=1 Tax=Streptomyces canus TaxID=58343 RepID=UPI00368B8C64